MKPQLINPQQSFIHMNNNIFLSILKKILISNKRVSDGVYLNNDLLLFSIEQKKNYIFDFTDNRFFHLGDILFFSPLAYTISQQFPVYIIIKPNQLAFINIFLPKNSNVNIVYDFDFLPTTDLNHFCIITLPYKVLDYEMYSINVIGLGNINNSISTAYPLHLIYLFLQFLPNFLLNNAEIQNIFSHYKFLVRDNINRLTSITHDPRVDLSNQLIFLCPYLGSGRFRDFFGIKFRNICMNALKLKSFDSCYSILLIGGLTDKPSPNFHFVDFRGNNIIKTIALANHSKTVMGIGFDNFWMHLFDLIEKPYLTKFRGRYTKSASNNHFNSINISFSRSRNKIYL